MQNCENLNLELFFLPTKSGSRLRRCLKFNYDDLSLVSQNKIFFKSLTGGPTLEYFHKMLIHDYTSEQKLPTSTTIKKCSAQMSVL
jgi:hypothetical protein